MSEANEFLGVISNFSRTEEGVLEMDVSQKRRGKLNDLLEQVKRSNELRSGMRFHNFECLANEVKTAHKSRSLHRAPRRTNARRREQRGR
jgi:uncharacterized membrane protein YccC